MPFPHSQPTQSSCTTCKHYFRDRPRLLACAAFPNGVPEEILWGRDKHTEPYRGDNGIQYEPAERTEVEVINE